MPTPKCLLAKEGSTSHSLDDYEEDEQGEKGIKLLIASCTTDVVAVVFPVIRGKKLFNIKLK